MVLFDGSFRMSPNAMRKRTVNRISQLTGKPGWLQLRTRSSVHPGTDGCWTLDASTITTWCPIIFQTTPPGPWDLRTVPSLELAISRSKVRAAWSLAVPVAQAPGLPGDGRTSTSLRRLRLMFQQEEFRSDNPGWAAWGALASTQRRGQLWQGDLQTVHCSSIPPTSVPQCPLWNRERCWLQMQLDTLSALKREVRSSGASVVRTHWLLCPWGLFGS